MREVKWNDGWKYWMDKDSFALVWNVPDQARDVTIPHDAMIESPANPDSLNGANTGFRDGGIYVYVKTLYAPEEYRKQRVALKFEGVYMNALVYVNGQLAAKNPFGYTTFYAELNDYLKYGQENEIRVQVRAGAMSNSRWYSGAGIYRDVYLLVSELTMIKPEGVQIGIENADEAMSAITVTTALENRKASAEDLLLENEILDPQGETVAVEKTRLVLFGNEARSMTKRIALAHPNLWSEDSPALYTCVSRLYQIEDAKEPVLLDETSDRFGIRTLQLDAKRGLCVNGRTVKLRGACIHHDSGLLGAATYEQAQYRQIKRLKDAGFNAIRMSHHPMAPAMLRACDELGMYVMDEFADIWTRCKSNYDYGLYFDEWWERDIEAMVRKDYNHPSVVLYSVGNEIPEIGTPLGARICHMLSSKIKSLDGSRFTLASVNGVFAAGDSVDRIVADVVSDLQKDGKIDGNVNDFMTLMDGHMDEIVVHEAISERLEMACAATDIAGYNYMTARYEPDGEQYPDRVIVGSETYPPEIARNWGLVEKLSHVVGDFTWTGWDYIGEAGVGIPAYQWGEGGFGAGYPAQLAYCGDIDLTGFRRPASYFREIVFGLRKEPFIAVQNPDKYGQHLIKTPWVISDATASWTFAGYEGKPVIVEVYAPGTEVELLKNGVSVGRKPAGKEAGFRTLFETTYEEGTLTAVVYEDGREISRTSLTSAKKERKLVLTPEDSSYYIVDSANEDRKKEWKLVYVDVMICDEDGVAATDCDQKLTLHVEGDAEAVGFGSGDPKPFYNYNEGVTKTFGGRALIILKKEKEGGQVKVKVTAENGMEAETAIML